MRIVAVIFVVALMAVAYWLVAAPAGVGDGENGARQASVTDRYQRQLPPAGLPAPGLGTPGGAGGAGGLDGGAPSESGRDVQPGAEDDGTQRERTAPPPPPSARPEPRIPEDPPDMARIGSVVMWSVLIVVLALVLFTLLLRLNANRDALRALLDRLRGTRKTTGARSSSDHARRKPAPSAAPGPAQSIPEAGRPLTEWEKFAQAGDYAGAVHAILRHAVGVVRHQHGVATSSEMTSREILRAMRSTPAPAQPMATIVGAVEFIHFGGRDATRDIYDRCADSLRNIEGHGTGPSEATS